MTVRFLARALFKSLILASLGMRRLVCPLITALVRLFVACLDVIRFQPQGFFQELAGSFRFRFTLRDPYIPPVWVIIVVRTHIALYAL
jgi:hypothetical protein